MNLPARIGNIVSRIPTPIWVAVLGPLIAIAGSEIQKALDTSIYPEINKERIKALEGKWEGFGLQLIDNDDSKKRLRKQEVIVANTTDDGPKSLLTLYDECTFKASTKESSVPIVWYPAHLSLQVVRSSFFSRKSLQGVLEITPVMETKTLSHKSNIYKITGRLEQSGDYIRLDYTNTDAGKKDFGTLLLENTSDGKLCGQFLSYGPISRGIVNGKYIFSEKAR
jgi:hypothetical protein